MKYFRVKAKCGHVSRNKYTLKDLYIYAHDAKEAAKIARLRGRVKHDHKDAIKDVVEIEKDEYVSGLIKQRNDPYFNVHCKQDQNRYCGELMIYREEEVITYKKKHIRRNMIENSIINDWKKGKDYLYE